jgi:branched-chain amino acid transport system substrate-binding protein
MLFSGLVITFLFSMFAAVSLGLAAEPEPKKLVWGLTASLSGAGAYWGQGIDNGAKMAIDDINSKGGIKVNGQRYHFDVKSYDHEFRPDKNLELMHRLVEVDKVDFLWTHGGAATVACLPYFAQVKKLVVHITTGQKMLTDKKGSYYAFKTLDDPPVTTGVGLQYIHNKYLKMKKIFDISPDNESGWDNSIHTKNFAEKYGMEVKTEYYPRGTKDFYPVITRGIEWNPDIITPSRSKPAALANILKQTRELGFKGLFYSESPYAFEAVKKAAGKYVEGWIFVTPAYLVSSFETAEEREFKDRYIAKHGGPFNDAALTTAQGFYVTAAAIEKAQSLDVDKIIKVMGSTKFKPLGRELSFVGDSIYPYRRQSNTGVVIVEVKDGKQVPISSVMYLPNDF